MLWRKSDKQLFRSHLTSAVAVPLALMVALAGLLFWQVTWLSSAVRRMYHTDQVEAQAQRSLTLMLDMETALRGYLLSGDQRFLDPYERAGGEVQNSLNLLGQLVADNPAQRAAVTRLGAASVRWQQHGQAMLKRADASRQEVSAAELQGKSLMDEVRARVGDIVQTEEILRQQRIQTGRRAWRAMRMSSAGLSMLAGAIIAIFTVRRLVRLSREHAKALQQAEQHAQTSHDLMLREQKARAEAEAANRRKDQFVAMMSHELRTPLTPVVAKLEMFRREGSLPAEMAADLEMIRCNVELETRLIDDLLDLSTLSQGKLRLSFETVNVHEKISNALEIHRRDIDARRQHVVLELRAQRYFARADAIRLQQVFWNLIGNATKYTQEGGSITIRTRDGAESKSAECKVLSAESTPARPSPPGTQHSAIFVEVSDSGIGIEPHVMARLFSPFEQGEQSLIRRYGGVGVGLSISKMLVQMHGGTLSAASEGKGKGATFTVELPTLVPEAAAAAMPAAKPRQGLRILLVEDNPDTLRIFARLLRSSGHDVKTATGVQAALEAAGQNDFDLLISDIGLPDGSGWELMQAVRDRSHLRGIAVSGFNVDEDVRRSKEAGFLEHLAKPVNPQELEAAIERAILPVMAGSHP